MQAAVRLLSQILKLVINDRLFPEDATVVSADRDWLNRTRPHLHALLEKVLREDGYKICIFSSNILFS